MESTDSLMNNPQVKTMFSNLMLIQKLSKLFPENESDQEKIMQLIVKDSTSAQTFVSTLTSSVANPEKKDEVIEDYS